MDELDKMIGGVKSFMERLSNLEGVDALGRCAVTARRTICERDAHSEVRSIVGSRRPAMTTVVALTTRIAPTTALRTIATAKTERTPPASA